MTVSDGMRKWEFLIDRVKFIVGSNQKERHQIHQADYDVGDTFVHCIPVALSL